MGRDTRHLQDRSSAVHAMAGAIAPAHYAGIWTKVQAPAWQARHNLTAAQYQQTFDDMLAQGFRPIHVSGYTAGGDERYAAIWAQAPGPNWQARHGLTGPQYQQTFDELMGQGFRPMHVSGYSVGGQDRYAGIWAQLDGPAWQARHDLTAQQYQQTFDELVGQGFRLIHVSGYEVGGQDRYAAIWEQSPGPNWQARHGLTGAQYQQAFDELLGQGFRPVHVSGYHVGGEDHYAALWIQDGTPFQARHSLTADEYQAVFDQMLRDGFTLACVTGYGS